MGDFSAKRDISARGLGDFVENDTLGEEDNDDEEEEKDGEDEEEEIAEKCKDIWDDVGTVFCCCNIDGRRGCCGCANGCCENGSTVEGYDVDDNLNGNPEGMSI